jgi:hypothetical protein
MLDEPPALFCAQKPEDDPKDGKETVMVVGGEARFRGRASANFGSEVGSPNLSQECEHAPQLSVKGQAPKEEKSSAEPVPKRSDPFGLLHYPLYIVSEENANSSLVMG